MKHNMPCKVRGVEIGENVCKGRFVWQLWERMAFLNFTYYIFFLLSFILSCQSYSFTVVFLPYSLASLHWTTSQSVQLHFLLLPIWVALVVPVSGEGCSEEQEFGCCDQEDFSIDYELTAVQTHGWCLPSAWLLNFFSLITNWLWCCLSSLVWGDSELLKFFFFWKMIMKLLCHVASWILWENEVLPSRRLTLQEIMVVYLLSGLSNLIYQTHLPYCVII